MAINNLAAWKSNFLTQHVQAQNVQGAQFLSSETVVVVSGPPSLTINASGQPNGGFSLTDLVPIGLVQNVSVAQQKQLQQVFEVGSKKPYFIPGRTIISAGISRILFDGPSLMYSMYLQSADASGKAQMGTMSYTPIDSTFAPTEPSDSITGQAISPVSVKDNTTVPGTAMTYNKATPGNFFINLASGFFNNPLGLGFVMYDGEQEAYGGFYLEGCYVQSHQFNISSQQTILVENVSLRCTAISPLDPQGF